MLIAAAVGVVIVCICCLMGIIYYFMTVLLGESEDGFANERLKLELAELKQ